MIAGEASVGVRLRAARTLARQRWHQFVFLWSMFSGGTHVLARGDSPTSAAIDIGTGPFFALVMLGAFWLLARTLIQP